MKFINYLKSIEGVGVYPLISLLIFFGFFVTLIYMVIRADKRAISKIKQLPLD
jgi:hypothetical protein